MPEGRQSRRRGAAKAASSNRQPNQTARRRGQRLDDSGTQAQGRRQGRAEESQKDHAQGRPQDTSDDARPILDGVGHSADQSVEPRSGQHADLRRKGAARGTRTHTRPTLRVGISGRQRSGSENGKGRSDLLGPTGTALTNADLRRGAFLQAGEKRTKQTSKETR